MWLFTVTKTRALVVSILCVVASIPFFVFDPNLAALGISFLMAAAIYGCIWMYKFIRDRNIIVQAKLDAEREPEHQQVIQMTSPGSSRLFVPYPLDK